VVGFRLNVSGVGAGFHFFQFLCGGSMEDMADASLTFVFDSTWVNVIVSVKEGCAIEREPR
jgi:hypothetical protein